jgi:hypothetical protein
MFSNVNSGLAPTAANRPSLRELFTLKERVPGTFDSYDELMARLQQHPAVNFTKFVNNRGLATKKFTLENGKLSKSAHIQVWDGSALRVDAFGVRGIRDFLNGLQTNECALWGVPNLVGDTFEVTTKGKRKGRQISRTRDYIKYADAAPGVLMLDFDARSGCEFENVEIEIEKLFSAIPELRKVQFIVSYSCSALIYHGEEKMKGIGGFRVYVIARVAADIPAMGELIAKRLWLAGYGYMAVSSSGALLARCLVDTSVWQPERCDFAARGVYADGLTSKADQAVAVEYSGESKPYVPLAPMLALRDLKGLTSVELKQYAEAVALAKKGAAASASAAREAWLTERVQPYAERASVSVEKARTLLSALLDGGVLPPEFLLHAQGGEDVTVAEVLADPNRWHRAQFLDPIEPSHRNGKDYCAIVYLNGVVPVIYSKARGQTRYTLQTNRQEITLEDAGRVQEMDAVKEVLLRSGFVVLNSAGMLSYLDGARLVPFGRDGTALRLFIMRLVDLYRVKQLKDGESKRLADYPDGHAKDVLAGVRAGDFPIALGVIDHPIIRPDGSIASALGFDERTGLYIVETAQTRSAQIPDNPTPEDALLASRRLLSIMGGFPVDTAAHRGVALAAMMTAVERSVMPEAPAFIFTAPLAGTGKTYLARCIGAICIGEDPHAHGPSCLQGAEGAKQIATWVKGSVPVVLVDNIPPDQPFGNPDLDALMTLGKYSGRLFGVQDALDGVLRALFLVTGNNIALQCDTSRRVLLCNLDSKLERPKDREFLTDPLQYVLANRAQIISDVLTIIQAWHCAGAPRLGRGRFSSYGAWDDLIRQPICWLKSIGLDDVEDPVNTQAEAEAADVGRNDTAELLRAIYELQEAGRKRLSTAASGITGIYGYWETKSLITQVDDAKEGERVSRNNDIGNGVILADFRERKACELALSDALAGVLGGAVANAGSKARSLGKWLAGKRDAPFDGLILRRKQQGTHTATYTVERHVG